jgi:hypothetical protein
VESVYAISFLFFVFRWCFIAEDESENESAESGQGKPPCPFPNEFLLQQKLSYCILVFYNLGFASFFAAFCTILWLLHEDIGSQLKNIFTPEDKFKWYFPIHVG